eukprot:1070541_1
MEDRVLFCTLITLMIGFSSSSDWVTISNQDDNKCADKNMFIDYFNRAKTRIGFIVLDYDEVGEHFVSLIFNKVENASFYISRVRSEGVTPEDFHEYTEPDLSRAAKSILPNTTLSCLSFLCTSGSFVIGQNETIELMKEGRSLISPALHYTHITNSVIKSLQVMNIRRIVLITPYVQSLNNIEKELFESHGFAVVYMEGLNLTKDTEISNVSAQYIKQWVLDIVYNELHGIQSFDAIFLSCSGWHSYKIVQQLEEVLNKPVLTSLTCAIWEVLRLSDVNDKIDGYGSLLTDF